MNIKHNDIIIDNKNPFLNCRLGREKYAHILTNIVSNYIDGFVLAINNEWGTGKTTFVKMWQKQLENEGFRTLYFNSWENDFDANPLIPIMAELKSLTGNSDSETFKSLITKGAILTKHIAPQIFKAIAQKYVNTEPLADLIEKVADGASEILSDEIKEYTEKKKGLDDFKKDLEAYIQETTTGKPLVFIIDELDRCRPSYAVEVLEQIKHLFSVPGIVFVLSIDKVQLGHAVRGVYGSENINANEYLRRFIDLEYSIPQPDSKDFCNYLFGYFQFISFFRAPQRTQYNEFNLDHQNFISLSTILFNKTNVTLRQQEKIFAHCRIGLNFFGINEYVFPDLYLLLIYLKQINSTLYEKIKNKSITAKDLISDLSSTINSKGIDDKELRVLVKNEAYLAYFYNNFSKNTNSYSAIVHKNDQGQFSGVNIVTNIGDQNYFSDCVKYLCTHRDVSELSLEHFLNKIDLTSEIKIG